jgi:cytidylate kinase
MAAVTVSRQFGSHADPIVLAAAKELGYEVLDKDLISEVAHRAQVDVATVEELDEEIHTGLLGFLSHWMDSETLARGAAFETGVFSWDLATEDAGHDEQHHFLDRIEYHRIVEDVVTQVRARDNVIIVGRGGALVLREDPSVFRVRITASVEARAERISLLQGLSYRAAFKEVEASDRRRAAFVRRWYHADWADPSHYHLVINTDAASERLAASLIVAGARDLADSAPGG